MSINNIFHATIGITYNLLVDGYQIDTALYSRFLCKLITYILNFCPFLSVYMLVLASIDRYFSSSLDARRRTWSNVRTAQKATVIMILAVGIFIVGNAISFDIKDTFGIQCTSDPEILLNQVYLVLEVIIYVILAPCLMIIFGFLTIYNIRQSSRNHAAAFRFRPSEKQLARMLIIQVTVQILLNLPFCIIFFILILPIPFRSTLMFYFLYILFKTPFYLTFITPFFLYILSAQVYRKELILILKKIFRIHGDRGIHPVTIEGLPASHQPIQ